MSPIEWSIKRKEGENWQLIPLADLAGKRLEDAFVGFFGKDIVAEFVIGGQKYYFCGTDKWKSRMSAKGKAVTFTEAIEMLRVVNPAVLEQICPHGEVIEELFPGSRVEKCTSLSGKPPGA